MWIFNNLMWTADSQKLIQQLLLFLHVQALPTASLQPKFGEGEAGVVPVGQTGPDDDVPPLVGAPKYIKPSRKETLWNLGNVEYKSWATHEVHEDDPWQEDSDFIIFYSTSHDCPVDGWDTPPHYKGHKVHQPDAEVLLLVEVVPGEGPEQDEAPHGGHVESAPCGGAPEGIVNT